MRTLTAIYKTRDLRTKLLWVIGIIVVYRIGTALPAPGVDYAAVGRCTSTISDGSIVSIVNLFSGGALLQLSPFALGIMPFITATIMFQLFAVSFRRLEELKKEGPHGQATINQYARYLTVGLAGLQAVGLVLLARTPGLLLTGCNEPLLSNGTWLELITLWVAFTGGAVILMWLAELITERGIGNGASLIIFIAIIASLPSQFAEIYGSRGAAALVAVALIGAVLISFVTYVERGQRRIPLQYSARTGSITSEGASTYLPLKVNLAGVVPVIFASAVMYLPVGIVLVTGSTGETARWVETNLTSVTSGVYIATYSIMIIAFAFFYAGIAFNPDDVADNLRASGGAIPGIRAGKPTAKYLRYVSNRLTTPGSIYLAAVAMIPTIGLGSLGADQNFVLGGISLLIIVSVGLDTVTQIRTQLNQHNYDGFLNTSNPSILGFAARDKKNKDNPS